MGKFRYLKPGLAILLSFIGVKMLLPAIGNDLLPLLGMPAADIHISTPVSLIVIVAILAVSIGLSAIIPEKTKQEA
jgi:tellurite resistance protein TerC